MSETDAGTADKSRVIVLNGPSSAGKSSISKALQSKMDDVYLHFQMDVFWYMVPPDIEANSENFPRMKAAIIDSAKALLDNGHNLIIDIVCMPEQMKLLQESFRDYDPYLVAVTADLETLNRRERERGNRMIGLSASQYPRVHKDIEYDFHINTTGLQAEEAADRIIEGYNRRHRPSPGISSFRAPDMSP